MASQEKEPRTLRGKMPQPSEMLDEISFFASERPNYLNDILKQTLGSNRAQRREANAKARRGR